MLKKILKNILAFLKNLFTSKSTTPNSPPSSTGGSPSPPSETDDSTALPEGFDSAPNELGYVKLTQVEQDRVKYLNGPDPAYRYWAKTVPHWYAIDDTLKAFTLSDAQRKKLALDLNQATVLLAMQGAGEWALSVAANIPDSAAFSTGDLRPDIAGVHLRNLAEALAHQRAHMKAINPDGLDVVVLGTLPDASGGKFKN